MRVRCPRRCASLSSIKDRQRAQAQIDLVAGDTPSTRLAAERPTQSGPRDAKRSPKRAHSYQNITASLTCTTSAGTSTAWLGSLLVSIVDLPLVRRKRGQDLALLSLGYLEEIERAPKFSRNFIKFLG